MFVGCQVIGTSHALLGMALPNWIQVHCKCMQCGNQSRCGLPKPTKIACGPCMDATQAAPPWYFIAGTVGIMGMHVGGAL